MLGIAEDDFKPAVRRRSQKRSVSFNEDEEVINPEDVDPSVGRFRNLVSTTVIPVKVGSEIQLGHQQAISKAIFLFWALH